MTSLPEILCLRCTHSIDTHSLGGPCDVGGLCDCVLTPRDIAAQHLAGPSVSAMLVRVGENMGDHAETVRTAVQIGPGESADALAHRLLKRSWSTGAEYDWHVELRMVRRSEDEQR